jgi:DNA-binding transcriptional LysR family regulator
MNLDLTRLNYFVICARTESFRDAARLLRVTPAAVSKSMGLLEDELGVALFVRQGRNVALTDVGAKLAIEAQAILADVERRLYRRSEAPPAAEALRIGSFEVFTTYFLGELLASERFDMPLSVLELTPGHLEEALETHRIDLGVTYLPVPRPTLAFVKVGTLGMEVFAASSSAFARRDFATWPFAVPNVPVVGAATRVAGLDGWPDDRVPRLRKYQVTMLETGLELVRRGVAVIYIPTFIARLHNRVVTPPHQLVALPRHPAVGAGRQPVYLVHRRSTPETKVMRAVARCLRRVCRP